ncbi:MAG: response regulator [Candidatus Ratteibacteria bacterium]|nr:response regulator [Candidatus Ratteibacteria bacterium]
MKNLKVLLVDDNPEYLELIGFYLKKLGYIVETVDSGEKALSKIKEERPSIIFLDLQMPKMDGLETLQKIKEIDKTLPVIIVSAHGNKEKEEEAKKLGSNGFYCKGDNFAKAALLIEMTLFGLSGSEPEEK